MQQKEIYTAIGLMSGTSMDGVDLALIESDGKSIIKNKKFAYVAYDENFKRHLESIIYKRPTLEEIKTVEREFTLLNAKIVNDFLAQNKIDHKTVDLIAFHGHTIFHNATKKLTWQIGDCDLMIAQTKIKTISNFRTFDIAFGGQGAPLVPIYHFHMMSDQVKPALVLNIGGISNITYILGDLESDLEAFDVCFGNAPFDDLVKSKTGQDYDQDGELSKKGHVDFLLADRILQNEIFHKKPPKSFDRDDFCELLSPINNLKIEDALATFAYMHAKALQINIELLSQSSNAPKNIFVCGGGRKNIALMNEMKKWLKNIEVRSVDEIGFNGDAIEAEAFAFLAIRISRGLPISFQKTTGISQEIDYGRVFSR